MVRYSAFDEFPEAGWTTPVWTYGAANAAGELGQVVDGRIRPFGRCIQSKEPTFEYPEVCRSTKDNFKAGEITEPGYLVIQPGPTSVTAHHFGLVRFTAPEAGSYKVQIELKTSDLGYGGTVCRVYQTHGSMLTPLTECNVAKSFGHHREIEQSVRLEKGDSVSLAVGPSPHGDNSSDSTLARMEVVRLDPAWNESPGVPAAAALLLAVLVYGLWRLRTQRA